MICPLMSRPRDVGAGWVDCQKEHCACWDNTWAQCGFRVPPEARQNISGSVNIREFIEALKLKGEESND